MSKGTASFGKKSGSKNMIFCRRCGQRTLTLRGRTCASCGFGGSSKKMRSYKWQKPRKKSVLLR
ncbi:50S ribosomal protein L37e [Candidatus Woesearchaeota archaeon]|nr:50S ribosomal protein L37e [Candidatus Woesearchaeota archaeon]